MTYVRSKMIYGCGPYYYLVKSVREGKTVRQVFIRYIGKTPGGSGEGEGASSVVPKSRPAPKPYLEIEDNRAGVKIKPRKLPKTWGRYQREQNEAIMRAADCTAIEADGLRRAAIRAGMDPSRVDWDIVQGRDMSYEDKLERLAKHYGQDFEEKNLEHEYEMYEDRRENADEDRTRTHYQPQDYEIPPF